MIDVIMQVLRFGVGFRVWRLILLSIVTLAVLFLLPIISVLSLGAPTVSFLKHTPSAHAAEKQGFYRGEAMPDNTYAWGNCTWWAYAMRKWAGSPIPTTWGNANTWDDYARRDGYVVDQTPAVGVVYQTDEGGYGHVAYVIHVDDGTGEWTISEMNAPTLNVVSRRTFPKDAAQSAHFIHTKTGASSWTPQLPSHMTSYGMPR